MKRRRFLRATLAAAAFPPRARAGDLHLHLRDAIARIPGRVGVYARTMAGGPPLFTYNAAESFPTASTIKLLIMLTAYMLEARRPGTLGERIPTYRRDLIGGSDFLQSANDGERFTVLQLVRPMIQVSDNSAANALIRHFGAAEITRVGQRAGLHSTRLARTFLDYSAIVHHMDNVTTPGDMGELLYAIERGAREEISTVASPQACRAMIAIMLGQTDRSKIPAGLPRGISCANKSGEIEGSRNDIAIVEPFGDSPYVISVYTKSLQNYSEADAGIAAISSIVYRALGGSNL
ncbi:MAG: serine hydrolase [Candidatus Baltobacteraceae bacterium]